MDEVSSRSGLSLIQESPYTLERLHKFLVTSSLRDILSIENDVSKVCRACLDLLKMEELNLEEIIAMFVTTSMLYFIDVTPENRELGLYTLEKTFCYTDTLNPVHIHLATKAIWKHLKQDRNSVFNVLSICHKIAVASETGSAIAICLAWTILGDSIDNDVQMYSFREFPELLKILHKNLDKNPSADKLYALVQAVGFLINIIVFGDNEDFKKAGYRHYFTYTLKDLEKLKALTTQLSDRLKDSSKGKDFWNLYMLITEYINTNICALLQDKITDMSN